YIDDLVILGRQPALGPSVAARHHAGSAVLGSEVGDGEHEVDHRLRPAALQKRRVEHVVMMERLRPPSRLEDETSGGIHQYVGAEKGLGQLGEEWVGGDVD